MGPSSRDEAGVRGTATPEVACSEAVGVAQADLGDPWQPALGQEEEVAGHCC